MYALCAPYAGVEGGKGSRSLELQVVVCAVRADTGSGACAPTACVAEAKLASRDCRRNTEVSVPLQIAVHMCNEHTLAGMVQRCSI